eukprot:767284-Hanusia_phi.AAC.5
MHMNEIRDKHQESQTRFTGMERDERVLYDVAIYSIRYENGNMKSRYESSKPGDAKMRHLVSSCQHL